MEEAVEMEKFDMVLCVYAQICWVNSANKIILQPLNWSRGSLVKSHVFKGWTLIIMVAHLHTRSMIYFITILEFNSPLFC